MKKLVVIDCPGIPREVIDKLQTKLCYIECVPPNLYIS
jgi:hypothetical protein